VEIAKPQDIEEAIDPHNRFDFCAPIPVRKGELVGPEKTGIRQRGCHLSGVDDQYLCIDTSVVSYLVVTSSVTTLEKIKE
jgi:hypothetical protein